MTLLTGDIAPDFSAPDQRNTPHKLADYKGKWVLLYFYPKDHTPGCIREACSFRDSYEVLAKKIVVLGVSADSVKSHASFAGKYQLPFPILADADKTLIQAYGTDGLIMAKRSSFLIDPAGRIAKIYQKVNPDAHAAQVLGDLEVLQ